MEMLQKATKCELFGFRDILSYCWPWNQRKAGAPHFPIDCVNDLSHCSAILSFLERDFLAAEWEAKTSLLGCKH